MWLFNFCYLRTVFFSVYYLFTQQISMFIIVLFLIFGSSPVSATEHTEQLSCSQQICISFKGTNIFLHYPSGKIWKKVELASQITQIVQGTTDFYVLTQTHIYVIRFDGSLSVKINIHFQPQSAIPMGDDLLITQDKDSRYRLTKGIDGSRVMVPIIGKLGQQEHFIASRKDTDTIFFYSNQIVYPNKIHPIVLLNSNARHVFYIDENLHILKRDVNFHPCQLTNFAFPNLINRQGFTDALSLLDSGEIKQFIRIVEDANLQDSLLSDYINFYMNDTAFMDDNVVFMADLINSSKLIKSWETFFARFTDLNEEHRRKCVQLITDSELKQEAIYHYALSLPQYPNKDQYKFLFSHFPSNPSIQSKILDNVSGSFFSLLEGDRTFIVSLVTSKGRLYEFIQLLLKNIDGLEENEKLSFIERYYPDLSITERDEIISMLLQRFSTNIPSPVIQGNCSRNFMQLKKDVKKFFESPEYKHIFRYIEKPVYFSSKFIEKKDRPSIVINAEINDSIEFLSVKLDGICNLESQHDEQGSYSRNIFYVVPVADVEAIFTVKKYRCTIAKQSIDNYRQFYILLSRYKMNLSNQIDLSEQWFFSEKEVIKDLKVTPNMIGEALIMAKGSGGTSNSVIPPFTSCNDMYSTCLSICSGKSDKSPLFSLSSGGSQAACEDKCVSAESTCGFVAAGKGYDKFTVRGQFCSAICKGSSNGVDCTSECTDNYQYWHW